MLLVSGNKCYINHSGKYIEINCNMKIPFQVYRRKVYLALYFSYCIPMMCGLG